MSGFGSGKSRATGSGDRCASIRLKSASGSTLNIERATSTAHRAGDADVSIRRRVGKKGVTYQIRWYDAAGRQRGETIGPSLKEARAVLAQRQYEVRSGAFSILWRRSARM